MDDFNLHPSYAEPQAASVSNTDFLDEFFVQITNDPPSSSHNTHSLPDDDPFFADFPFLRSDAPPLPAPPQAEYTGDDLPSSPNLLANGARNPDPEISERSDSAKPAAGEELDNSGREFGGDAVENMVDQTVFKRPFSPRSSPTTQNCALTAGESSGTSSGQSVSSTSFRMRRDFKYGSRLEAHPVQKCFLTGVKRKRPETDTGHVASILGFLQDETKLMLPDAVLIDYLTEAGVQVDDTKVARLIGAAAEHHTASIIQDVLQIFMDGQQERKKNPGRAKESDGPKPDKVEKVPNKPKSINTSRPNSGSSSGSSQKKGTGRGKKRKHAKDGDEEANMAGVVAENGKESDVPVSDSKVPPATESVLPEAAEGEEDAQEKATTKSTISKEGEDNAAKKLKKEKDKEVEKRSILTLDLLAPVLREQGYQVGRPPYFVN